MSGAKKWGTSAEDAIPVDARNSIEGVVKEDEIIARILGPFAPLAAKTGQALVIRGGRKYDVINMNVGGRKRVFYFDITDFFGANANGGATRRARRARVANFFLVNAAAALCLFCVLRYFLSPPEGLGITGLVATYGAVAFIISFVAWLGNQ
jgi:hypothetical protein